MTSILHFAGSALAVALFATFAPIPAQTPAVPALDREDRVLRATPITRWDDPSARPGTYAEYLQARARAGHGLDAPFSAQLAVRSAPSLYASGKRLDLLVFHALLTHLSTRLTEYRQDLEREGWAVSVWQCSGGTPPEVRAFLAGRYTKDSIHGGVIVGDLPVPWFEMDDDFYNRHSEFPCDLYYMDLDGTWGDKDVDGKFDSHGGSEQPEIFIGRLVAGPLAGVNGNEIALLDNYFRKAHAYRSGVLAAPGRALAFVDDDWYYKDTGQQHAYATLVSVTDKATTTAANYKKRLAEGYASVVLCAHSSPSGHSFKVPGSTGGRVNASEIWSLDPPCLFYNLFACSNARYTTTQYMAGIYIFAKSSGLIAVGSTKTGAMQFFSDYYKPLGAKETFGSAFRSWFAGRSPYTLYDRQWLYGMTLLGDPTLRIGIGAKVTAYGKGCPGTFATTRVATILPGSRANAFGNSYAYYLLGYGNHRYQQVFGTHEVPSSFTAGAIAFRHDEKTVSSEANYWAELTLDLGWCPNPPDKLSNTFAANAVVMTKVLKKKQVSLPSWTAVNPRPDNFIIKIPLDTPFAYTAKPGQYLILDGTKTNSSKGSGYAYLYLDSVYGATGSVGRVAATSSPYATTGQALSGYGLVIGFVPRSGGGIVPCLDPTGKPGLGTDLLLRMSQARTNSPYAVSIGFSDRSWSGLTLPFDLVGIGAPGCNLLAGMDLALFAQTDNLGSHTLPLPLPMNTVFCNTTLYFQGLVLDPPANGAGLVTTNGLKLEIGR